MKIFIAQIRIDGASVDNPEVHLMLRVDALTSKQALGAIAKYEWPMDYVTKKAKIVVLQLSELDDMRTLVADDTIPAGPTKVKKRIGRKARKKS